MKTQQELASNEETRNHIDNVRRYLRVFAVELLKRGEQHDQSKLGDVEAPVFAIYTDRLKGMTYGSDEYNKCRAEMKVALDHHYAKNRHHPEFFENIEEWRPVVGFETSHEVSNHGRVRSKNRIVDRSGPTGSCFKQGILLKQYITPKGYCRLQLQDGDNRKNAMVHRLVAEAFIDNDDKKSEVNHKNGIKDDNHISNLEWVTSSENQIHAYDNDLKKANIKYEVTCEELDITTLGINKMEKELRERGYDKARASAIWNCINNGGKHLDLTFTGTLLKTKEDSYISDMTLVDIVEMFCDWFASSQRHADGNILKSITHNKERFGINEQLSTILENTADLFDSDNSK
jgi:hypothetical protein